MSIASAPSGNGDARRWEGYALKILSALFGILSILFWDVRREVNDLRRTSDQRTASLEKLAEHDTWILAHRLLVQEWAVKLALIEKELRLHASKYQRFQPRHGEAIEDD